jgi:tetratricopeptide (TPR) repeat protein
MRAVEADPADVNARARLAELMLTEGDRAGALAAISAIPEGEHTALSRAVEGLAALSAYRREAAMAAFEQAIALDSEAPLPRLGLGLALIRAGDLAAGRREIELAAALDPRRAQTRSWLGRAYYEEGLTGKARSQFEMAKARDPDDPTPWLLSARQLYAANRPVEAVGEIEAARGRGENRAVLRGAAGLGEDRAVNAAALGRAYEVLGFSDQAIGAGARAAEQDPTNPEAHRLLSDVLRDRPYRGSARSSALLQAQVYEPPSTTPIQPQLAESDLALLDTSGAARASFAEFSPFFDSDGVRVVASGSGGTQDSFGDEVSVTAKHKGVSVGVGQFHYQTEGFTTNNDVTHDVVSVQGKAQLNPWLGLFAEYRYRNTENGDRMLEFDLSEGTAGLVEKDERNLARLGFHAEFGAGHDVAGVFTYVGQDASAHLPEDDFGFASSETSGDREAYEGQVQHVGRFGNLTTVSGLSYGRVDTDLRIDSVLNYDVFCDIGPAFCDLSTRNSEFIDSETEHFSAYHYSTLRLGGLGGIAGAELTAGLSVDAFDDSFPGGRDTTQVNPKLGARIEIGDGLILRGAYTHALKGDPLLDQRLEPVTVAGFTQVTDQVAGATIRQAAVGADAKLLPWLWVGGEAAWRWVETPRHDHTGGTTDTDEREFRGYVNATLGDRVAATLGVSHERSKAPLGLSDLELFEVTELRGGASYFDPSGFFASAGIGYVWHEYEGFGSSGNDDFPIADAAIGYRLPNERGVISLEIQNAFDESFGFEDRPLLSLGTTTADPRFAREFSALARVTLNF